MKLRNKKTGEIIPIENENEAGFIKLVEKSLPNGFIDWEVVEDTNVLNIPLIKDEKIRKAVRAWAECCYIPLVKHYLSNGLSCFICNDEEDNEYCLDFTFCINNLEAEHIYTIAELCGSEE